MNFGGQGTAGRGRKVLLAGLVFHGLCLSARAALVEFNNYVSPTDNDLANQFQRDQPSQLNQVPDHGITGGSVASPGGTGSFFATYRSPQIRPTPMSISFFYNGAQATGVHARLGWAGTLSGVDFLGPSYFYGDFFSDTGFLVTNNPTGQPLNRTLIQLGTIGAPPLGHWLQVGFSAVSAGGADFQLGMTLHDLGISGTESPTLLFSGSTQVTNALAAADSSVYPGFYGYYRAPYYDNFDVTPIPEPSGLILAGLAAWFYWRCAKAR